MKKDRYIALDEILKKKEGRKQHIIPILQSIQEQYHYLPEDILKRVCEQTEITPEDLMGVASFYSQFISVFLHLFSNTI